MTDLMLNFTVPGTTCELVAGGSDRAVTLDNLEQYLQVRYRSTGAGALLTVIDYFWPKPFLGIM